jgi:hypothetical protein
LNPPEVDKGIIARRLLPYIAYKDGGPDLFLSEIQLRTKSAGENRIE